MRHLIVYKDDGEIQECETTTNLLRDLNLEDYDEILIKRLCD